MTHDEFCAALDALGYAYERTASGVDVQGYSNVDLTSLTALPEGTTFSNGGAVDLTSLTALPEGTTFSNGGYVDLTSLTDEYQQYRGERIRLKTIDGYTMLIRSTKKKGDYTLYRAAYFGGGELADLKKCWIAQHGEYFAHGDTVGQAMRDVRFKIAQVDFDPRELVATIKARGTVQFNDFRLATGACVEGLQHGMEQAGLDPTADELPLETVLTAAFGPYGEQFKRLFEGAEA